MKKIFVLILMVLALAATSCIEHSVLSISGEPQEYRIVKNGNDVYWVETRGWYFDGVGYSRADWGCVLPCVHYKDALSAENYLNEILRSKTITVIKTATVK